MKHESSKKDVLEGLETALIKVFGAGGITSSFLAAKLETNQEVKAMDPEIYEAWQAMGFHWVCKNDSKPLGSDKIYGNTLGKKIAILGDHPPWVASCPGEAENLRAPFIDETLDLTQRGIERAEKSHIFSMPVTGKRTWKPVRGQ